MRVAPDQFQRLVRAAWPPQARTCFYRYHPSPSKRKGEEFPGHYPLKEAMHSPAQQVPSPRRRGRLLGLGGRGKKSNECYFGSTPTCAKMIAFIGSLKDDTCAPKACQARCMNTSQSDNMNPRTTPAALTSFYHLLPSICLVHLLSSGLLWIGHCVTCAWPQTNFNAWSELPGHPRLEPAVTDSTQRTTTPKALEEFKVEDDCNEGQMEKDCGGGTVNESQSHGSASMDHQNLIY